MPKVPRTPSYRPVGALTGAATALLALSTGWFLIGLGHVWEHAWPGWVPLPLLAALAAYACWRVTRRAELPGEVRRFWGRIALACAALSAALVSNAVDALTGPGAPTQWLSIRSLAFYMSILLFVTWALLRLPSWQRSRADWIRFGLDATIVLLTTTALVWHFSLRKVDVWTTQTGSSVPMLAIVAVASISVIALIKVTFTGTGQLDRRALYILSAGVAAAATCGATSPFLIGKPYLSSTFIAGPVAAIFVLLAAERQLRAPLTTPAPPTSRRFTTLPYVAAAALGATLIGVIAPVGGEELTVAVFAVTLTGLVAVRQIAALRENTRLLDTVDTNLQQLREYQEKLDHQVTHDALTGMANRALFTETVTGRLAGAGLFHVALLDIDDFKVINDRLGHGMGDELLRAVSDRLSHALGPGDTAARLGGDEFTLVLADRSAEETAALLVALVAAVQEPLAIDGHDLTPRISLGVTTRTGGDTPEELLRRADVAMYAAKNLGGGRWHWFDPIMDQMADADARLSIDLRQSIARDELFLLYQPIVSLPDGRLSGVEALVRWRHAEHGLVSPAIFIPLAERSGFIVELGHWVLREVIRQTADWISAHGERAPARVSVNISARQLQEPDFPAEVARLLREAGLDPGRLVAEVTETAVLGTGDALDAVKALHDLGLRVALDDFGTGQSSLSLLVDCPVGILKVDKSFVDGVTAESPQAVIVDGLIGITTGLRIEAVAEGVETAEQAERLHRVGYRYAQGFHFARPMAGEDVALLLDTPAGVSMGGNLDKLH